MLHDILFALWFLLPTALANVSPILTNKIPGFKKWQAPIDGGRMYRGRALLGPHKTWRGLVSGLVMATAVLWLQQLLVVRTGWAVSLVGNVDYAHLPTLVLGPLFGLGAIGGDAIESFFKRRLRIPSGDSWIPFDQLDYIIGGILVSLPFVLLRPALYGWMLVLYFVIHLGSSYLGWRTGFKERPI
jgi:CDP-2,3-bis-(O-geranylgeranyl)-sn-glycerol synthase